jgi:arsenate reductase-like glutaredoxin family protein
VDLNKGLSVDELDQLIGSRDHRLFLNTRNELYRARGMKDNPPSREEALRLMSENPNLIKRPILVKGGRIALGVDEIQRLAG